MRSRRFILPALLAAATALTPRTMAAQTEVGIPFSRQDGYVLEFAAPYQTIRLDFGETQLTTDLVVEAGVAPALEIVDARGRPVERSTVLPGMEVVVAGEKLRSGFLVRSLRLRTRLDDWRVEVSGVFERLDGTMAVVGGQRVALDNGAAVQGAEQWRGRSFRSFDQMMLGSFVELSGRRGPDGLVRVREGRTWPNLFTETERALNAALKQGLQPPQQLAGGVMRIGDEEFRLVQDRALQAYVTRLGTSLIPRWMNELPEDDPARVVFRFYVIEDPAFNAAAWPDGTVIVHTGLLKVVQNEAQLAAVLGHEIGHVTHEHGRERYEESRTRGRVGSVIGGLGRAAGIQAPRVEVAGEVVDLGQVAQLGAGALSNVHSRGRESQADRVGLFYMVQAGYDPREAAAVWRRIAEATKPANAIESVTRRAEAFLFSSHPEAAARARSINREIAATYAGTDFSRLKTGAPEYQRAIAGLR
jgi:hypothetical protein